MSAPATAMPDRRSDASRRSELRAGTDPPLLDEATIGEIHDSLTAEMRAQLIDVFEEQCRACVSDVAEAVRRGDRAGLRRVAHLLKGSSASLGASALRHCCEGLERSCRSEDAPVTATQVEELAAAATAAGEALRSQLA
jgi:HPt (histidine-containing phosphotransfer) domain-containing protein